MGDTYYHTRLRWYTYHGGVAKLHGVTVRLTEPPQLPGVAIEVAEIDYAPEYHMWRVREKNSGWRDMDGTEARAADVVLKNLVNPQRV